MFLTHLTGVAACWYVKHTNFSSAQVHVSQSVGDLESEAGSAALVLERGRLRGFGLGARPAPRLRSWSEAGSAASVLEPAPGPHQGFFRM